MRTTEDQTVAAGHSVDADPARWQELLDELLRRVAGRFARVELRRRARAFVRGVLADLPRKNCRTIAEHAGDPSPDGMQHLLGRQCGTTTRSATTCVATSSSTWARKGRCWSSTRPATSRRAPPPLGSSASTPAPPAASRTPATRMLTRALEARQVGYVLPVACDHPVRLGGATHRADTLLGQVPARAWQQVSAGKGAKGHRYYDWAFLRLDHDGSAPGEQAGQHWLMIRRNQRTGELACYRCSTPARCRLLCWSKSPGGAGPSKSASRPARAWSARTSTRCAAGAPGAAGPPWPCWPTPSWSWQPLPSAPGTARADRVDLQRASAPVCRTGRSARR
jgi:hypothetical protein